MNIIVRHYATGAVLCRPDTTWEREDRDIYLPDDIGNILYSPVLFARISKAGKCIGSRFASRYYDGVGYGILLYPIPDCVPDDAILAVSSCMDRTSVLPFPIYNRVTLENGTNSFIIYADGNAIYSTSEGSCEKIEETIVLASGHTSVRIGDIVCTELAPASMIPTNSEISATFCGNDIFRFSIRR